MLTAVLPKYAVILLLAYACCSCSESPSSSKAMPPSILADFKKVGQYTESYRKNFGRLPTDAQLDQWLKQQKFEMMHYSLGLGVPLGITDQSPACTQIRSASGECRYSLSYDHDAGQWVDRYKFDPTTMLKTAAGPEMSK